MFRKNKNETSSFDQWKAKKSSEKNSKELGRRLRNLIDRHENDKVAVGEALEIIQQHGDDPVVMNSNRVMCWTPIFLAVLRKNHELVKALMCAPAVNINARDYRGSSLLIFTMTEVYPNHALIKYLLTRGDLDLSIKTKTFHEGFLLASGPEVHMYRGASALFCATASEELYQYIPAILDKLGEAEDNAVNCLPWGSDMTHVQTRSPLTNLVKARETCKPENRDLVLSCIARIAQAKHDTKKKSGFSSLDQSLTVAATQGDRQVVEILLGAGANPKPRGERTAYDVARYAGHHELAEFIKHFTGNLEQQMTASAVTLRR